MGFRMPDPAGARRLAGQDAGLYQWARFDPVPHRFRESLKTSCRLPAFGASLPCPCDPGHGCGLAGRRMGTGRRAGGFRHCRRAAAGARWSFQAGRRTRKEDRTAIAEEDTKLVEIRLKLEELGRELLTSAVAFRPRLSEINARMEQLGPPPAEGQPPEPDIVTSERRCTDGRKGRDQRGARHR